MRQHTEPESNRLDRHCCGGVALCMQSAITGLRIQSLVGNPKQQNRTLCFYFSFHVYGSWCLRVGQNKKKDCF